MSALRRFAASSNEVRVRVLGSMKKLISVLPCKRRDFFDVARSDLFEGVGGIEDEVDFLRGELAQAEKIFAGPARRCIMRFTSQTRVRFVIEISPGARGRVRARAVGRFFPTKSGRIGSSRWPRSIRAAS